MTTTAFVLEILVAGLLAMVWLLVAPVTFLFPDELGAAADKLENFSGYSVLLGFLVLAVAYTLGWLVNSTTYWLAHITYRRSLQRQIIGKGCTRSLYEELRTCVLMQKECEEVVRRLSSQTSVHRVARAGGLNFMALGSMVILLGKTSALTTIGAALLVLGLSSWWVAIDWHREYMSLLRNAAVRIPDAKQLLAKVGERSESFPDRLASKIRGRIKKGKVVDLMPGSQADG